MTYNFRWQLLKKLSNRHSIYTWVKLLQIILESSRPLICTWAGLLQIILKPAQDQSEW